ncbi:MAG: VWA domain-containing protein [Anaerolineae bacterium]
MTFTAPIALLLLLVLPVVIWIGRPRLAYRRRRDLSSLLLRAAILTLVILALAGAQSVRSADSLAVVFVVDASASMGSDARTAQIDYIQQAIGGMRPEDQAGVVVFGGDAVVERAMNQIRQITQIRSTPNTSNTDFEEAINLGLALLPSDAARRLVILSDGLPTIGDPQRAAERAAAVDVEISYVNFARDPQPEVALTDVRVPESVTAGQQFDLSLTVEAEAAMAAAVSVEAGGITLSRQQVDLQAGVNNFTLPLTAGSTGFRDFRVIVTPLGTDGFYQNNQLAAFSRVIGSPRVLVVSRTDEESRYLVEGLTQLGLEVTVNTPSQLRSGVAQLEEYSAVVLANIPATVLTENQMRSIQTYVRDLGGGLIVVGGPEAYAPGGYFQTPLEETLPVQMQLQDQQRIPQLTIEYVVDRSGSMAMVGSSGVENVELAKEAIIRSIEFLQPSDRAGVIGFDAQAYVLADVQPVLNRGALQALVGTLTSGGGTDIMAGMRLAAEAMQQEITARRHIILLTDGGASDRGLVDLTHNLNQDFGVTTSVIAIGGENPGFLIDMATEGGGNYHVAESIESIPTIFTQETVLATRSYIIDGDFTPATRDLSSILNGITSAPPLHGYVATTAKQTAQVALVSPDEFADPILATWQYGLGRAVAFTSDATARWANDWVQWPDFARFWNQAVRWAIVEGTGDNLETRVIMNGETARVIVDARGPGDDNTFWNGLDLQASVVRGQALEVQTIQLQQVAPGRYEATFTPTGEGAYFLRVSGTDPNSTDTVSAENLNQTSGWVMSYSPEFALRGDNRDSILSELAAITSGGDGTQNNLTTTPERVFDHNLNAGESRSLLAPYLLLLALVLLPVDVAVRRLIITRSDLGRLRAWLNRTPAAPETREVVTSLQMAKQRAQLRTQETAGVNASGIENGESFPTTTPSAPPAVTPPPVKTPPAVSADPVRSATPPPAPKSAPAPAPDSTDGGNLAGKLLERRRNRGE